MKILFHQDILIHFAVMTENYNWIPAFKGESGSQVTFPPAMNLQNFVGLRRQRRCLTVQSYRTSRLAPYSGGPSSNNGWESECLEFFRGLPQVLQGNPVKYLKAEDDSFFITPFSTHCSKSFSFISNPMLWSLCIWWNIVK